MKFFFSVLFLLCCSLAPFAQILSVAPGSSWQPEPAWKYAYQPEPALAKLRQRNTGMIIGLQRGRSTSIELGGEAHWRKISLRKPSITGATANLEYNFGDHVIGYKAGVWFKRGRVNLTYGGHAVFFTDFKGMSRYGIGPAVGFRLLGFHLINGYNILGGDRELDQVNTLHMTLRYYFPIENKFTWDRSEKKKREKARERRKREREREKEKEAPQEKKKLLDIFKKKEKSA
jgi:hypothetical protein